MWPSFVINLAQNVTRLENSRRQMDDMGIPWTRLDAVNGWALSDAEIAEVYSEDLNRERARYPLVRPEIGCALSHIEAWRRIAEGSEGGGFVFEDDFSATPDLPRALELLSAPQSMWDMVKLFSFDPAPRMVTEAPLGDGLKIGIPYRVPTCLTGYGLTKEGAARLLQTAVPVYRPVDEQQKFVWETGLRVALVTPPPVGIGDQEAESGTVGSVRRADAAARRKDTGRRLLHQLRYQLGYTLRLHLHRMAGRGK
jgi:glycosyl transferase family 25